MRRLALISLLILAGCTSAGETTTSVTTAAPLTTLPEKIAITGAQIASPPELALQIRGGAGAARIAHFQPMPGNSWEVWSARM